MYWIAEKQDGEIIVLTEREALIHFESNNISNRMRLRFLGTTTGPNTKEAQKKIGELVAANRPENYPQLEKGQQNLVNSQIRAKFQVEIKKLLDDALAADIEDAKKNGVKQPNKSLRIHTMSQDGHSREAILQNMQGMQ